MRKLSISGLMLLFAASLLHGQTTLTVGDIAILGYNTDDPDQVVFVPLVDLSAGTVIYFTDNAWSGTALASNEGTYTYTAASTVTKGTTVTLSTTGMSLSNSGDQILAYQGSAASPTFIYGLSSNSWITSGSTTTTTSYKPSTLTSGSTAISFTTERDNGYFNVTTNINSKNDLLLGFANTANWTTTDTRVNPFPTWSITVTNWADEPTASPTALTFTSVLSWKFTVGYTAASPAPAGYLVIRRQGAAPTGSPADGSSYSIGDNIGDAKVAYVGTATSFVQQGIVANTAYYYIVYSYNGSGSTSNYKQSGALSGNQTSGGSGAGSYYSTVNHAVSTFISDLQTVIRSPYTKVTYDNFDETNVANFAFRDTTGGQKVITCIYSGQNYVYTAPLQWYTSTPFSREHTWCHSWMPSYSSTSVNEYSDQHHLFPINQTQANAVRSNHPLGEVVTVISSYLEGSYGYDASGNLVYEPRNSHKGDAARALFYMSVRYDGVSGRNWKFNYLNGTTLPALSEDPQDLTTLQTWNDADPPDNYEIARNDYIQSIQQNRNPFVDNPSWTDYINFDDLSYIAHKTEPGLSPPVVKTLSLEAYPVPFSDELQVSVLSPREEAGTVEIYSALGNLVSQESWSLVVGENHISLPAATLPSGWYVVRVSTETVSETLRVVK